nr:MAG TPA: hypothetical protein [Caudoviricetes sp.]
METATIEFTKEDRAKAREEWLQIEKNLQEYMVETMEHDGYTVNDPKSIAYEEPDALRMWLVEVGQRYINEVFTSDLLTRFLTYDQHKWYMNSSYDVLIEDAETCEEREEWTARAVLEETSLWDAVDAILTDYSNAVETLSMEVAEECREAWYI